MGFDTLPVNQIVEGILGLLLATTLYCCWRLERRLKHLRDDQENLADTIGALNGSITAAQLSLAGLRAAAKDADETLGRKLATARAMTDELALLNAAGERIATRMESARDIKPASKNAGIASGAAPALRAVR